MTALRVGLTPLQPNSRMHSINVTIADHIDEQGDLKENSPDIAQSLTHVVVLYEPGVKKHQLKRKKEA